MSDTPEIDRDKEALKNRNVLNSERLVLRIPSKILLVAVTIPLTFLFFVHWLIGLILLALFVYPLYHIHKDDPKAIYLLVNSLTAPLSYQPGKMSDLSRFVINENPVTGETTFSKTSKENY